MPDWLIALLGMSVGVFLKGWADDHFRKRMQKRAAQEDERKKRYELLLELLGDPYHHFAWLLDIPPTQLGEGEPLAYEKVQLIADWIHRNGARFPEDVQRRFNRIRNVSYALLTPGSRRDHWSRGDGRELVDGDWETVREYKDRIGAELFD